MAFVKQLVRGERASLRIQPTQVVCRYTVGALPDGRKLLQLDTHGSEDRELPGKLSQTLQLDEETARALWALLGREFKFS